MHKNITHWEKNVHDKNYNKYGSFLQYKIHHIYVDPMSQIYAWESTDPRNLRFMATHVLLHILVYIDILLS